MPEDAPKVTEPQAMPPAPEPKPSKAERDAAAELARHHTHEELVEIALTAERGTFIEDDPSQVYRVGIWGRVDEGQPNYCCRLCSTALTGARGPALILQHYKARHAPDDEESADVGLVNARGEPLAGRQ